jgi:hypothetical protein
MSPFATKPTWLAKAYWIKALLGVGFLCAGSVLALFLSPCKVDCLRLWRRAKNQAQKAAKKGNATRTGLSGFSLRSLTISLAIDVSPIALSSGMLTDRACGLGAPPEKL